MDNAYDKAFAESSSANWNASSPAGGAFSRRPGSGSPSFSSSRPDVAHTVGTLCLAGEQQSVTPGKRSEATGILGLQSSPEAGELQHTW